MSIRRLLTKSGVAVVVLAVASTTAGVAAAQAAAPPPTRTVAAAGGEWQVDTPRQLVNRAQAKRCLTFAVTPDGIPTAVMIKCNKGSKGQIQLWTHTADGHLMVTMSKDVGGELPNGACLDTVADLATTKRHAPLLVLPCRDGDGQRWTYDSATGQLVNKANGKALSSMAGVAKQARPTSTVTPNGGADQMWLPSPIPMDTLLGAIIELLDALLEALGLEMPGEYETAGKQLLSAIDGKVPVPDQLKQLPRQLVQMAG